VRSGKLKKEIKNTGFGKVFFAQISWTIYKRKG
jgi:hypothetical protein